MTVGIIRSGNATSLGVVTTKTEISPSSGLFMPSDAKVLLSVKTAMSEVTPTAGQTVSARLDMESSDVGNMSPFEVLFAPIGSMLNTSPSTLSGMECYDINAPLKGGEALHLYGTPLVANTVAPEAQAWMVVSNDARDLMHPLTKQMKPQHHAKLGTFTATGTTADTDVAGSKYSFSGGRRIVELFGEVHPKAVAAADHFIGEIKYTSSEFVDSFPQSLPLFPMSTGLGATIVYLIPGISRQKVDIPVKPGQVNIQDYLNFGGVMTAEGSFIDGVIYV